MNSKFTGLGDADAVQKKPLAIFAKKQQLLSIDMKRVEPILVQNYS